MGTFVNIGENGKVSDTRPELTTSEHMPIFYTTALWNVLISNRF